MPNYVYNSVYVNGTPEEIRNFKQKVVFEDSEFSFQAIIPMPKSLRISDCSYKEPAVLAYFSNNFSKALTQKNMRKYKKMFSHVKLKEVEVKLDKLKESGTQTQTVHISEEIGEGSLYEYGKLLVENFDAYGASTWYDWRWVNWGTKWDAGDVILEEDSEDQLHYTFSTAWNAPDMVFKKLSELFPNLTFDISCEEEQGYGCEFSIENGVFTLTDLTPWEGKSEGDIEDEYKLGLEEECWNNRTEFFEKQEDLTKSGIYMAIGIAIDFDKADFSLSKFQNFLLKHKRDFKKEVDVEEILSKNLLEPKKVFHF